MAVAACEEKNYNPFAELIELAQETQEVEVKGKLVKIHTASVTERIKIACEIAQYIDSKKKNVEPEGTNKGGNTFNITINRFQPAGSKELKPAEEIKEAEVVVRTVLPDGNNATV
jgi:hypothetical protein